MLACHASRLQQPLVFANAAPYSNSSSNCEQLRCQQCQPGVAALLRTVGQRLTGQSGQQHPGTDARLLRALWLIAVKQQHKQHNNSSNNSSSGGGYSRAVVMSAAAAAPAMVLVAAVPGMCDDMQG